jgi:hypothetical protein
MVDVVKSGIALWPERLADVGPDKELANSVDKG